ncbi:MAG: bifunctional (p)ppGpp synthetase/guanosine-3',5'-bis(diphosphate) 3'-pyrophosphohydrolase [Phycisphaeraceae bacterium]|nr:bifunctional (p)ppGpp synthetase/guanosine-3',5'-bis(diphosphate) 3'-pyrophosphohydrolase [Phycisphaeraceae bacterium]
MRDTDLWQRAASFAAAAHRHQTRRDGVTPYAAHAFRVALTVRHVFNCDDPVCLAAALLHDVIEDTGVDYDEIMDRFGPAVADCVAALTKNMALPEAQREAEYDAQLANADWRARLVKLADQYDNLCDLLGTDAAFRARAVERARRALALAERDRGNACTDRARAAVDETVNRLTQS